MNPGENVRDAMNSSDVESSRKHDVIDVNCSPLAIHGSVKRDLPVLTLPSSAYNALYGHNQPRVGLRRHVTSPRLLSPSFVRASVNSPAQMRLLRDQAVASSHIYAQQLRQDFTALPTMFPYAFTHPLPGNQILTSHFKHVTAQGSENESEETILGKKERKREHALNIPEERSSPDNEAITHVKHVTPEEKSHSSSTEMRLSNEEGERAPSSGRAYPDIVAVHWNIEEVCKFVSSVIGSTEYCDVFREQEIDGQALILLTEDHLSNKMGMKLGPALKLKLKIDELRCVYSK